MGMGEAAMIKFNEDYSFERDKYQWILHHSYDGRDKDKNPKRQSRDTYHATLEQICQTIVDREAGRCTDMAELQKLLINWRLTIEAIQKHVDKQAL
jgi:hypothetical protein